MFCGRNIDTGGNDRNVKMMLVTKDTIIKKTIADFEHRNSGHLIRKNSSNKWIVACNSTLFSETGDFKDDFTFLLFFDEQLNLISDGFQSGKESHHMRISNGMVIDVDENIIVTGTQFESEENSNIGYGFPSVTKFDHLGNHLWTNRIGNSKYNKSAEGRWHGIIESKEKDGYILVGSEAQEPRWTNDSLVVKAAIAKISVDGDSIWYRTYSYREGLFRVDKLYDVILSSDGHYVACGESFLTRNTQTDDLPWIQSLLLKTDSNGIYLKEGVSSIEVQEDLGIKIYPNPVRGPLYISQDTDVQLVVKVIFVDGKEVDTFTLDGKTHTHILDTSVYQSGRYYLVVTSQDGRQQSSPFVVGI